MRIRLYCKLLEWEHLERTHDKREFLINIQEVTNNECFCLDYSRYLEIKTLLEVELLLLDFKFFCTYNRNFNLYATTLSVISHFQCYLAKKFSEQKCAVLRVLTHYCQF